MDTSVVVIDIDVESPRPVIPRHGNSRHQFSIRPGPLLGIVVAHVAIVAWVVMESGERIHVSETEPLVSVFIRPKIVVSRAHLVAPRAIRVPKAAPLLHEVTIPQIDPPAIAIAGVGTRAPQAADETADVQAFARLAGLQPGQGATVVLRLEVNGDGSIGQVFVETSGGTDGIDRAAIDYVKALIWSGGAIDGRPTTMWIRWGVRLQA